MTWSAQYKTDIEKGLVEIEKSNIESPEHKQQYVNCLVMATELLISGVVGGPDYEYTMTLTGHGNSRHEPEEDWSGDFVSIIITQGEKIV